ncbi:YtfJ family protein [Vibrio nigripulchritudo]|uniref:YtfJ family protein n=1 Tax=Vibrio nigripulchritudo TaxID=28173 RepID=UPI0003B21E34|nr:YtfJ family protein [Vibrio nigripulchritudo]CCN69109.1 putative transcriptional regulator [Vibrio nigripulchritudo SFn118]
MKIKLLSTLVLAAAPIMGMAHTIEVGKNLPSATVSSHGELMLNGDKIEYSEWSTGNLNGKVRVIQAIAGRSSSKKMNAPLMAAITEAKFPRDSYQTTTIINQDDAMWGTGSFVKSSAEDSKKEFSWSSIILDKKGAVASTWELQEESSAIAVIDKAGQVLFVKEGSLNQDEIAKVIELVKASL